MRVILAIVFAVAGAVCWLVPRVVEAFPLNALPVSVRESAVIGALFFVAAAILFFIRPSDDKAPYRSASVTALLPPIEAAGLFRLDVS
jgi:hypothetical protein